MCYSEGRYKGIHVGSYEAFVSSDEAFVFSDEAFVSSDNAVISNQTVVEENAFVSSDNATASKCNHVLTASRCNLHQTLVEDQADEDCILMQSIHDYILKQGFLVIGSNEHFELLRYSDFKNFDLEINHEGFEGHLTMHEERNTVSLSKSLDLATSFEKATTISKDAVRSRLFHKYNEWVSLIQSSDELDKADSQLDNMIFQLRGKSQLEDHKLDCFGHAGESGRILHRKK